MDANVKCLNKLVVFGWTASHFYVIKDLKKKPVLETRNIFE